MSQSTINGKAKGNVRTTIQTYVLALLRMAIGWHFLYEGISKLFTPNWSSAGYLMISKWIFSGLFQWIAANPPVLKIVDFLNVWGLVLIGLALILGCCARVATIAGMALLLLYYLANPPFVGMDFGLVTEGNYLIVDKNLIELIALLVLALSPSSHFLSLDRLIKLWRQKKSKQHGSANVNMERREILKNLISLPVLGAFVIAVLQKRGWESFEEKFLQDAKVDAMTTATIKTFNFSTLNDLKDKIPHAQIRGVDFSRIILGGNLIGGWAHARDLIYVSKLIKAYHHDDKVFETLWLAEKCGINALLTNPLLCRVINEYWRRNIGKIKFISDCGGSDLLERVQVSIDNGASACYVQGGKADYLVQQGKIDEIGKALDLIWKNGLPAGIGAHSLETVKKCVEFGLEPDFWMKTLHHHNYWSAKPKEEHDNIWCNNPEETIEFMKKLEQPWIAFKVLAAGAIHPKDGFKYAFENGADFICVGMYDFQIVDDVNIALNILGSNLQNDHGELRS